MAEVHDQLLALLRGPVRGTPHGGAKQAKRHKRRPAAAEEPQDAPRRHRPRSQVMGVCMLQESEMGRLPLMSNTGECGLYGAGCVFKTLPHVQVGHDLTAGLSIVACLVHVVCALQCCWLRAAQTNSKYPTGRG